MFSEKELAYLKSQRLARIATVSAAGEPDVAPVGFAFDGEHFLVGGMDLKRTLKYKNAVATGRVALVVDDFPTADPPQPRGIKIHGKARISAAVAGRSTSKLHPSAIGAGVLRLQHSRAENR